MKLTKLFISLPLVLGVTCFSIPSINSQDNKLNESSPIQIIYPISFSGEFFYVARLSMIDKQSDLVHHGGYYGKFILSGQITPQLVTVLTLFGQNHEISNGYYDFSTPLRYRLFAEYKNQYNLFNFRFRLGDLGRVKIGEGLTIDEFESEGGVAQVDYNKGLLNFLITKLPSGFTGIEDINYGTLSFWYNRLGVNYLNIPFYYYSLDDKDKQNIFSIYGNLPILKYFVFYGEFAVMDDFISHTPIAYTPQSSSGIGYLIGTKIYFNSNDTKFTVSLENRYYSSRFNLYYQLLWYPRVSGGSYRQMFMPYQGLDTEDKKVNNWRNYIITSGQNATAGYNLYTYLKKRVYKSLHIFSELEYLNILKTGDFAKLFLFGTAGLTIDFSEHFTMNFGWSNKAQPYYTSYVYDYPMFVDHSHLLMQVKIMF